MKSAIVAMAENRAIGYRNGLPWHLSTDLKRLKAITMGHHLIMGRKTWDSVGKPLPGRTIIVVTRQRGFVAEGVVVVSSTDEAFLAAADDPEILVLGGAQIFEQTLSQLDRIYLSLVHAVVKGDTFFPDLDLSQWIVTSEELVPAGPRDDYAHTFRVLDRAESAA